MQVFIRSFGFDGYRTEVQLAVPDAPGKPGRTLASLPVTLTSGFQAATLSFRSTMESHKVAVSIPTVADEISDTNNTLLSEIAIDRTKIRVLYIEGSAQPLMMSRAGEKNVLRGAHSDLSRALMEDDDIECVVISSSLGGGQLARVVDYGLDASRGFPDTKAELAAFDAIILSDVPERAFTEKQLEWIEEWVGQRGGGLLMAGGPRSFSAGGWDDTRIAEMLPVDLLPDVDWNSSEQVRWLPIAGANPHPVWTLFTDQHRNVEALKSVPGFSGATRFAAVRPNLTTVLADGTVTGAKAPPVQPMVKQPPGNAVQDFFRNFVGGGQAPPTAAAVERAKSDEGTSAALVAGRYGRGRTMAIATAITPPWASDFTANWKQGDQNNYMRFWRNVVYWLTENSSIGRRRLIASADKRFYRPGDTIAINSAAFNELARQTKDYRIVAMIEPNTSLKDNPGDYSPLRWPEGHTRTSGEEGPFIAWGEEIEIPLTAEGDKPAYGLELPIAEALSTGGASHSLRLELTAYEDYTQVDSTSLDLQILHDPFELQNPFPNHELLKQIATLSGGQVLDGPRDLAQVLASLPVKIGPPITSKTPLWSTWPLWTWIIGLLTVEWLWRRKIGLA
ncbi:MAG: glutamine amidotransferase [Gemmataceae bacterium]|nr:glutamine amidotransferase [Gemmataceae bacterium]